MSNPIPPKGAVLSYLTPDEEPGGKARSCPELGGVDSSFSFRFVLFPPRRDGAKTHSRDSRLHREHGGSDGASISPYDRWLGSSRYTVTSHSVRSLTRSHFALRLRQCKLQKHQPRMVTHRDGRSSMTPTRDVPSSIPPFGLVVLIPTLWRRCRRHPSCIE